MAETTITEQIVREAPEIEAYKLGLFQDAQKYIRDLQAAGIQPPAQGIAGFTAEQLAAGDIIRSGIGGYEDYLGGALSANQAAQQMIAQGSAPLLQESLAQQQAGISGLEQARQLALAQRQAPFQIRDQALRGLSGAATDIARAGSGVGSQVFAAQQGLGRAGQLGLQAAQQALPASQRAQQEALRSVQQTGQLASQGIRSIGQAQRGIAGQVGGAQQAQQLAAQRARQSTGAAQRQLGQVGGSAAQQARLGQQGLLGAADQIAPNVRAGQAGTLAAERASLGASRGLGRDLTGAEGRAALQTGIGQRGIRGAAAQVGADINQAQRARRQAEQRARQSTAAAQQQLGQAGAMGRGTALSGIRQLRGSAEQFDPSGIGAFMDPFTREVIEAEQAEIARLESNN